AMSRKRDVRKKRSAGSAGILVADAEAAIGGHSIVALRPGGAVKAARNDNAYGFTVAADDMESAARAILRVRFETGSVEKSFNGMFIAPRIRGSFVMVIWKGRTVTLRYVTAWRTFASGSRRSAPFFAGRNCAINFSNSACGSLRIATVGKCHMRETRVA